MMAEKETNVIPNIEKNKSKRNPVVRLFKYLTVEPVILCYVMPSILLSVAIQNLALEKVRCTFTVFHLPHLFIWKFSLFLVMSGQFRISDRSVRFNGGRKE